MNIQELELEFVGGGETAGFLFKQKAKTDYGYIYEVNDEDNIHYEIFERIVNPKFDFENKRNVEGEFLVSYPKSTSFGIWSWTTRDYNRAIQILKEIKERVEYRESTALGSPTQSQPPPILQDADKKPFSVLPE